MCIRANPAPRNYQVSIRRSLRAVVSVETAAFFIFRGVRAMWSQGVSRRS
jgi:hypothetical protein